MKLGERIHQFRTERNLSQGDLADALNVSRQSVSKWETDTSVPELDKLVKLCELFGVSLDELVRGVEPEKQPANPLPALMADRKQYARLTLGVMLLAMAVMACFWYADDTMFGLALAAIPAVCGIILLLVKRHPFLWVCWGLYWMVQLFLLVLKGARSPLILIFTPSAYRDHLVYDKIIVGWVVLAVLVALIAAAVLTYRRDKKGIKSTALLIDLKKIEY